MISKQTEFKRRAQRLLAFPYPAGPFNLPEALSLPGALLGIGETP